MHGYRADGKAGRVELHGGSKGFTRYSSLAQINGDNVKIFAWSGGVRAWTPRLSKISRPESFALLQSHAHHGGRGRLFSKCGWPIGSVNPATGKTVWLQQPFEATMKEASGQSMRGIDSWRSGSDLRLLLVRGSYLYAVNAKDGTLYSDFGDKGRVNLQMTVPFAGRFHWTSGPIVVRDVIVVAGSSATNGAGDGGFVKEASPDNVRGYDVRTGKLLWTFDAVPKPDEPGYETWGSDSAKTAGNLSAWCPLSGDEKLGLVYLPFTAPTASYYGGWRPGDNLYSDSLVAVDAQTGKMKWYYQMIHHDLWEYDNIGPPVLGEITVNGQARGRGNPGEQERLSCTYWIAPTANPCGQSKNGPCRNPLFPANISSPTQPFPTKPPAFDLQGLSEDDLIDFTPELHKQALQAVRPYVLGPSLHSSHHEECRAKRQTGAADVAGGLGIGN